MMTYGIVLLYVVKDIISQDRWDVREYVNNIRLQDILGQGFMSMDGSAAKYVMYTWNGMDITVPAVGIN